MIFIKTYLYDQFLLDWEQEYFLLAVMKLQTTSRLNNINGPNAVIKDKLEIFYDTHFVHYFEDNQVDVIRFEQTYKYMAVKIKTDYDNNIKNHFVKYVERYVNVEWNKYETLQTIDKDPNLTQAQKKSDTLNFKK